jgi:hypothetical protein
MELVSKQYITKEILDVAHSNSILNQMLSFIPRHVFQRLEREHLTGRQPRTFGLWNQFVCLMFIQLSGRKSMRDCIRNLQAAPKKLYHLGLKPVSRSTFSDANNKRPSDFFQALFGEMYRRCAPHAPKHKFRFKSKLMSLDSSTISLCLSVFPWASFRSKRGGVKMHTLLDHDGHIPAFVCVSEAKKHDLSVAKTLTLPKGSIVAFDKAYNDYRWFHLLGKQGVHFVTRQKSNASYRVVKRQAVNRKLGVTSDQIIEVATANGKLKLRRVGFKDQETGKHYKFLTNNFKLAPKTIADIYKERWKIELFFKEIKQNLKIKSFVGNSENAVLTQIYTALIVYLIAAYIRFTSRIGMSVQQMLQLLQVNVFGRIALIELFRPPQKSDSNGYDSSLLRLANLTGQ